MEIDEKQKITVLLSLLNERYNAAHRMREKSLQFATWLLGFAVAFAWILVSGTQLGSIQKGGLTALAAILAFSAIWFLRSLEAGAAENHKVMINLEKALGCYEKGLYLDSESVFPEVYRRDFKKSWRSHFKAIYILIIPIAVVIILLIWIKP